MGRMKELAVAGVTDLVSYLVGVEDERERIIKLIEGSIRECECASVGMTYCRHNWTQTDLIALIKGEAE